LFRALLAMDPDPEERGNPGPDVLSRRRCHPRRGGQTAGPVAVMVAEPFLAALMAVGKQKGGDLKLDQLLQAVAGQLGDQLTGCAAIQ